MTYAFQPWQIALNELLNKEWEQQLEQLTGSSLSTQKAPIEQAPVWLLAYSGGLDSSVLLHSMCEFLKSQTSQLRPRLIALHVQHNLSPNSAKWAAFCKQQCADLRVDFISRSIQLSEGVTSNDIDSEASKEISNLESKARKARYQVFEEHLPAHGVLFLAQHQDDQAETFLYRALRGSGSRGLAAIPKRRTLGAGHLLRPLLAVSRGRLQEYAEQHELQWVNDESNQDTRFDRNYIRQQLMPLIQRRWPQAANTLSRCATLASDSERLQQDLAELDMAQLDAVKHWRAISLAIPALLALAPHRQANVLRYCCLQQQLAMPHQQHIEMLLKDLIDVARRGMNDTLQQTLHVQWPGGFFRYSFGRLYCSAEVSNDLHQAPESLMLEGGEPCFVNTPLGRLDLRLTLSRSEQRCIRVSYRQGGERLLWGDGRHRTLKNKWQEWQVPQWWRDDYPLVLHDDEVISVPGFYTHPDWSFLNVHLAFFDAP